MARPAPKFFYVADKSRKLLFQMEERSGQPAAVREFECIHGRVEGDKQKQGDLKTPEGVYFLTKVITQKLDFMEYGPHAVALNYPNPADRLRKKTGSGILQPSALLRLHGEKGMVHQYRSFIARSICRLASRSAADWRLS